MKGGEFMDEDEVADYLEIDGFNFWDAIADAFDAGELDEDEAIALADEYY